jgi:hypothetical protein
MITPIYYKITGSYSNDAITMLFHEMQQKRIFIRLVYGENRVINNNLEVNVEKTWERSRVYYISKHDFWQ